MAKICGVLAMQGDYAKHCEALSHCGVESLEVRNLADLRRCERLIIPGGESTTIYRLLSKQGLCQPLLERVQAGMPMFGTCAGMILLSRNIIASGQAFQYTDQPTLAVMDLTIQRNAYGPQIASFCTELSLAEQGLESPLFQRFLQKRPEQTTLPLVFIRAPIVLSWGTSVQVLLRCPPPKQLWRLWPLWQSRQDSQAPNSAQAHQAVCFQQNNILACSFHPELEHNTLLHEYFLSL